MMRSHHAAHHERGQAAEHHQIRGEAVHGQEDDDDQHDGQGEGGGEGLGEPW